MRHPEELLAKVALKRSTLHVAIANRLTTSFKNNGVLGLGLKLNVAVVTPDAW